MLSIFSTLNGAMKLCLIPENIVVFLLEKSCCLLLVPAFSLVDSRILLRLPAGWLVLMAGGWLVVLINTTGSGIGCNKLSAVLGISISYDNILADSLLANYHET